MHHLLSPKRQLWNRLLQSRDIRSASRTGSAILPNGPGHSSIHALAAAASNTSGPSGNRNARWFSADDGTITYLKSKGRWLHQLLRMITVGLVSSATTRCGAGRRSAACVPHLSATHPCITARVRAISAAGMSRIARSARTPSSPTIPAAIGRVRASPRITQTVFLWKKPNSLIRNQMHEEYGGPVLAFENRQFFNAKGAVAR
jgi:hypothetical protein